MKKRILTLIIAGAVVLSAVSGCTETKNEGTSTTPAAVTTPADEGTKAPEESKAEDTNAENTEAEGTNAEGTEAA